MYLPLATQSIGTGSSQLRATGLADRHEELSDRIYLFGQLRLPVDRGAFVDGQLTAELAHDDFVLSDPVHVDQVDVVGIGVQLVRHAFVGIDPYRIGLKRAFIHG